MKIMGKRPVKQTELNETETGDTMNSLEVKRVEKLHEMLQWRLRPGANGYQMAEAEAIAFAIEIIECFFEIEGSDCSQY